MTPLSILDGRYRLTERLGEGGMSVVWRAYDEELDRPVAVKVLSARYAADAGSRLMILDEARAAAHLVHPHICNVYDYGESRTDAGDHVPYIVMELLSGATLAEELRAGPLATREALRVGVEVASALATAHDAGVVHRDVEPANVILTPAGVKVVGFGIAAVAGEPSGPDPDGGLPGTPGYVAPERLTGGTVRAASDVYGLGLLLYRSLTGSLPWRPATVTQMVAAGRYVEPAPLPPISDLPREAAALVRRCLAQDPEQRPTAYAAAQQLAEVGGWHLAYVSGGAAAELDAPPQWSSAATPGAAASDRARAADGAAADGAAADGAAADGAAADGAAADDEITVVLRTAPHRRRRREAAVAGGLTLAVLTVVAVVATGAVVATDRWQRYADVDVTALPPAGPVAPLFVPPWVEPEDRSAAGGLERVGPADQPDRGGPAGGPDGGTGGPGATDPPPPDPGGGDGQDGPTPDPVSNDGGSSGSAGDTGPGDGPDGGPGDGSGDGSGDGPGDGSDGGAGTGGGSGAPEQESEPAPESIAPEPVVREVTTLLGTLVVQCVGSTASLVSSDLLPGVGLTQSGPGLQLGIVLDLLLTRVSVTVECQAGEPIVAIGIG